VHSSSISIWFFIGVLLSIYGALIVAYGIYEWATASYPIGVQLTELHAPVWWGALLLIVGLFYLVRFRPSRGTA
jgi:heme/copper-type cytochrome/quinol oxidase subunit 3